MGHFGSREAHGNKWLSVAIAFPSLTFSGHPAKCPFPNCYNKSLGTESHLFQLAWDTNHLESQGSQNAGGLQVRRGMDTGQERPQMSTKEGLKLQPSKVKPERMLTVDPLNAVCAHTKLWLT